MAEFFPENPGENIQGINLAEYTGNDEQEVADKIKILTDKLDNLAKQGDSKATLGYTIAMGHDSVNKLWAMRKNRWGY